MRAFRCARTWLLFPGDYFELWGSKYGIGLGRMPVSEAFVNDYTSPPAVNKLKPHLTMHPLMNCMAPVIPVEVTEEEFILNAAICRHVEDKDLRRIGELMKNKQLIKSIRMQQVHGPEAVEQAKRFLADRQASISMKIDALRREN